jgi:hypothetical protein
MEIIKSVHEWLSKQRTTILVIKRIYDVSVNSEASVVTSSISRFAGSVFKNAYRGRICVHVFIWISMRVL